MIGDLELIWRRHIDDTGSGGSGDGDDDDGSGGSGGDTGGGDPFASLRINDAYSK